MSKQVPAISADTSDWSREIKPWHAWDPGKSLLASIRRYQRLRKSSNPLASLVRPLVVMQHRIWSVITGADIPLNSHIAGGLSLPHPNGIVIHPDVVIGPNCLIFQQVTLGDRRGAVPRLEGHVDVGAGAKIIGGVRIGAHAKIGANAVVLDDVPAGATAIGVPARIISRSDAGVSAESATPTTGQSQN